MIPITHSLSSIQSQLLDGSLTIVDLVQTYLNQIKTTAHLNIYIEVYSETVLAQAIALDKKIASGQKLGQLYGCVCSVKDVIAHKGHAITAASKILDGYTSPYNATAVSRLLEEDAIIIGRTNCDEFGMGSANENSIYGPTLNGVDPTRIPGGSSGAAAVSVQMDTCLVALGSDTGGSVRQPASFCGVYGLKPTYGAISRYGLIAYASSFDQIGLLSKDTDSIKSTLSVISGKDVYDATSTDIPTHANNASQAESYSVAIFPSLIDHEGLDDAIRVNFLQKIEELKASNTSVVEKSFQYADYLVPSYYILTTAEASTNLSRYDGIRYGYRSENDENLQSMYVNTRTEGFGKEVKRRILLGTYVLSEGYYDAYFTKAQQVRRLIRDEIESVLDEVDFIAMPVSTKMPWKVGSTDEDPVSVYLSDMYTVLANLAGLPAISVPSGENEEGLPYGIQLISKKYSEYHLLSFANTISELSANT